MNERPRQRELETTTETKWAGGRRQKWKPRRKKMDEFLRVGFSKPEDKLGVLGSISYMKVKINLSRRWIAGKETVGCWCWSSGLKGMIVTSAHFLLRLRISNGASEERNSFWNRISAKPGMRLSLARNYLLCTELISRQSLIIFSLVGCGPGALHRFGWITTWNAEEERSRCCCCSLVLFLTQSRCLMDFRSESCCSVVEL